MYIWYKNYDYPCGIFILFIFTHADTNIYIYIFIYAIFCVTKTITLGLSVLYKCSILIIQLYVRVGILLTCGKHLFVWPQNFSKRRYRPIKLVNLAPFYRCICTPSQNNQQYCIYGSMLPLLRDFQSDFIIVLTVLYILLFIILLLSNLLHTSTCIKQSPVLKYHIFRILPYKMTYELDLFEGFNLS